MREVLVTGDPSFALSGQLALDAAGIPYTTSGNGLSAVPWGPTRLFVVDDADFERARSELLKLEQSGPATKVGWTQRIGIAVLAIMLLAAVVALVIHVVRGTY